MDLFHPNTDRDHIAVNCQTAKQERAPQERARGVSRGGRNMLTSASHRRARHCVLAGAERAR